MTSNKLRIFVKMGNHQSIQHDSQLQPILNVAHITTVRIFVTPAPVSRISRLDAITTHWSKVDDLSYFALRYEVAIRKYLSALLKHPETVQEVTHDVMVGILKRGLGEIRENAGRFRDYLRTSLRHAVFQYWKKQARQNVLVGDAELDQLVADQPGPEAEIDRIWVAEWRACLLERTWRSMMHLQQKGKLNAAYYTILKLAVDNPGMTSTALAAKAEAELNRTIRPDAYRQLLRRARRHFAELLHDEVASTLDDPTPEALVDEFIDLGILDYMRDYINPKLRYKLHR